MSITPFKDTKNISIHSIITVFIILSVISTCIFFYCRNFLEPKAYDFLVRLTSNQKASENIINVVIDDDSLAQIGRFPWKRTYYADIFEYLELYGKSKAIAFDSIITSYGEKEDDEEFFNRIDKLENLVIGLFFSKKSNNNQEIESILKNKFALNVSDTRTEDIIKNIQYAGVSSTPKQFLKSAKYAGSVLSRPDSDGVIRKIEPLFLFKDNYYPSLALAVYSKITDNDQFKINNFYLYDLSSYNFKIPIKISNGTFTYVKWYKPIAKDQLVSHKTYSAWKIIKSYEQLKKGEKPILDPQIFKNKIVVVGATASALYDIKITPMGVDYPGVDIQSTFIDNFIHDDFMSKAPLRQSLGTVLIVSLVTLVIVLALTPLQSSIILTLLMLAYFNYCIWSYFNNFAIDVITPQMFIILTIVAGFIYRFFLEGRRKEKIKNVMGKYLSEDVVANIMKNIDDIKPGGERGEITVLFSDIRNFTSISETLEPEEVSSILCKYFSEMVPLINKYNGTLNKFVGDAILAVFNAPIRDEKHPQNAILCAQEMLRKVDELQQEWLEQGKPKIDIGIGINTGDAFVGSIGSKDRLEYTVIGDTVNVASRIEAQNRLFGTRLLISKNTYERVKTKVDVIRISSVSIRGKSENMDIYEILSINEKIIDRL